MTDSHKTILVTDEHLDLIYKTIALQDEDSKRWFEDTVSFGVRAYLEDDCIMSGMRMSEAKREILQILNSLEDANQRLERLNPLLRIFLFKYPAGMTDAEVKEWFGPKVVFAGDRSLTSLSSYTNEELFFRSALFTAIQMSSLLQNFLEATASAPLQDFGGNRKNGRKLSCVSYFAWVYSELALHNSQVAGPATMAR